MNNWQLFIALHTLIPLQLQQLNKDLVSYYKERAKEYEKIYNKPERQNDLLRCKKILRQIFSNKSVFEIACGTGYWTEVISHSAKLIKATDINETVIDIARAKEYSSPIEFEVADIFHLKSDKKYESLFGGFIWSHIKLQELNSFLEACEQLVVKGGTIVFIDNNYVEGSNLPLTAKDDEGNTYQTRTLENGTSHLILKNFPTEDFIRKTLEQKAKEINFYNLQYYWIVTYKNL